MCNRKFRSYYTKKLRGNRTAAELNHVANATRRRRRILLAGFYFCVCANGSFRNVSVGEQHGIVEVFLTVSFFKRDKDRITYRKKKRTKILKDKERKKRTK